MHWQAEAIAVAKEHEAKSGSQLLHYWKTFKGIKQLVSSPHEEIPEQVVRNFIAQQHGIKPEEVTAKQINLAVAGLLREYPAIRLIPSEPAIAAAIASHPEISRESRKAKRSVLRDHYFASFPEKIMILDVCWAAKQRYREWTRWLSGELKDVSKPDRAFLAVLNSDKRPEEYRPEPRPKAWK